MKESDNTQTNHLRHPRVSRTLWEFITAVEEAVVFSIYLPVLALKDLFCGQRRTLQTKNWKWWEFTEAEVHSRLQSVKILIIERTIKIDKSCSDNGTNVSECRALMHDWVSPIGCFADLSVSSLCLRTYAQNTSSQLLGFHPSSLCCEDEKVGQEPFLAPSKDKQIFLGFHLSSVNEQEPKNRGSHDAFLSPFWCDTVHQSENHVTQALNARSVRKMDPMSLLLQVAFSENSLHASDGLQHTPWFLPPDLRWVWRETAWLNPTAWLTQSKNLCGFVGEQHHVSVAVRTTSSRFWDPVRDSCRSIVDRKLGH